MFKEFETYGVKEEDFLFLLITQMEYCNNIRSSLSYVNLVTCYLHIIINTLLYNSVTYT